MNYFYSSKATCFHDRNCTYVAKIAPLEFRASAEMPENLYMCGKCRRDMLIRRACSPRTKQMGQIKYFLHQCCLDDVSLKRYILQDNMKMYITADNELMIHCNEDTWKVSRDETGELTLWHNNYVRISETERYVRRITDGFHKQICDTRWLKNILDYVESYTWEKHLIGEEKKAEREEAARQALVENMAAETAATSADAASDDKNKKRRGIFGWLSRMMERLKMH